MVGSLGAVRGQDFVGPKASQIWDTKGSHRRLPERHGPPQF